MTNDTQLRDSTGTIINPAWQDGMRPSSPIHVFIAAISRNSGVLANVVAYTVTTGKTLYITEVAVSQTDSVAGSEFTYRCTIATIDFMIGRCPAGDEIRTVLGTPKIATSGQQVLIKIRQWTGGALFYGATLSGYEV